MRTIRLLPVPVALLLAACASDPVAANDPHPVPFAWCADEARAAASQPLPKDADSSQRQAVRDFHMSKACQRAYQHTSDVRLPALPRK